LRVAYFLDVGCRVRPPPWLLSEDKHAVEPAPPLLATSVAADAGTRTQRRGRRDLRRQRDEDDARAAALALNMRNPRFWGHAWFVEVGGIFFAVMAAAATMICMDDEAACAAAECARIEKLDPAA
jgi:hypothetical protein